MPQYDADIQPEATEEAQEYREELAAEEDLRTNSLDRSRAWKFSRHGR